MIKHFINKGETKMKRRKTLIISLLLVAALALGIGYAGFTSELLINGDAVLNGTDTSLVNIKNVALTEKNGAEVALNVSNLESKTVNADVTGFRTTQDYAILTVTVENPHEFAVNLTAPVLTENNNDVTGGGKYLKMELLDQASIPTSIPAATYVSGTLTPATITFQYKITPLVIPADAHTVSYTISTFASTR